MKRIVFLMTVFLVTLFIWATASADVKMLQASKSSEVIENKAVMHGEVNIPEFEAPLTLADVSETEPNNTCGTADPLVSGDRVTCATMNLGSPQDVEDYFTFTLSTAHPVWTVVIETQCAGTDCPDQQLDNCDTKLYLYDSDCENELAYNNDIDPEGNYNSRIYAELTPGTYVIKVTAYSAGQPGGAYHMTLNYQESFIDCPDGTFWSQVPGENPAANSDTDGGLTIFENLRAAGTVTDVHFYGIKSVYDNGWLECSEDPQDFVITFYPDDADGMPDIAAGVSRSVSISALNTGYTYGSDENILYRWDAAINPPVSIVGGWISIAGGGDSPDCWFLWQGLNYTTGGYSLQYNISTQTYNQTEYDLSICLTGTATTTAGACCNHYSGECLDVADISGCSPEWGWQFYAGETCGTLDPPCAALQGACCVYDDPEQGDYCITTDYYSCDNLGGNWYVGEDCATFNCPPNLARCASGSIWDNGTPTSNNSVPVERWPNDPNDYETWCVDDVSFDAYTEITSLHWWAQMGELFVFEDLGDFIILSDNAGVPGDTLILKLDQVCTRTEIELGGWDHAYYYSIENLEVALPAGDYWFGMRALNSTTEDSSNQGYWIGQTENIGEPCYFLAPYFEVYEWTPSIEIWEEDVYLSFCVGGSQPTEPSGACCDDFTITCDDNVLFTDCFDLGRRFGANTACVDLDPPCGTTEIPEISVDPTEVFGTAAEGSSDMKTVTVSNIGTGLLEFDASVAQFPVGLTTSVPDRLAPITNRPLILNSLNSKPQAPSYPQNSYTKQFELRNGSLPSQIIPGSGEPKPIAASEFCDVTMTLPWEVYSNYIYGGGEMLALFQNPEYTCETSPTYPFLVTGAGFAVGNITGVTDTVEFTVSIYDADMTDPNCPVPSTPLYTSPQYSSELESGSVYYIGWNPPIPISVVVNGPYFLVVTFVSDHNLAPLLEVFDENYTTCWNYDDWNDGMGWREFGTIGESGVPNLDYHWYTIGYTTAEGCDLTCAGTAEPETCGDDVNGGCGSDPVAFGTIDCNSIICGTVYADAGTRDLDWYNFTITEDQYVFISLESEFPGILQLIDASDCENITGHEIYTNPCATGALYGVIPSGTWTIVVLPDMFEDIPCDGTGFFGTEYELSLECQPVWLSIDNVAGTAPPDVPINVMMDATNLVEGTYTGAVIFDSNDGTDPRVTVPVTFEVTTGGGCYQFVPGDANMVNGQWPVKIIGGDVTYLVGWFRGFNPSCLVGGFFNSADANGDCIIIGSDVTRLVGYFRGLSTISHCPNFDPCWLTPSETDAVPRPTGWPNCE